METSSSLPFTPSLRRAGTLRVSSPTGVPVPESARQRGRNSRRLHVSSERNTATGKPKELTLKIDTIVIISQELCSSPLTLEEDCYDLEPVETEPSETVVVSQSLPDLDSPIRLMPEPVAHCIFCFQFSGVKTNLTITTDGSNVQRYCRKCSMEDPPIGSKICTNPNCRKVHLPPNSAQIRRCVACSGLLYTKKK